MQHLEMHIPVTIGIWPSQLKNAQIGLQDGFSITSFDIVTEGIGILPSLRRNMRPTVAAQNIRTINMVRLRRNIMDTTIPRPPIIRLRQQRPVGVLINFLVMISYSSLHPISYGISINPTAVFCLGSSPNSDFPHHKPPPPSYDLITKQVECCP